MIKTKARHINGFTIIEMVIVIVIIGILTVISVVSYNGIQAKARDTTVLADMDDIDEVQTQYGIKNSSLGKAYYSGNVADADIDFSPNEGNVIDVVYNGKDYCIRGYNPSGTKNSIYNAFKKGSSGDTCEKLGPSIVSQGGCPAGFITVPGSVTYGTIDFCVMKYEAKNVGGKATSQAALLPWASISQTDAIAKSKEVCTGCHLITDAEWLTIAKDVVQVPSNWDHNVISEGYMYNGNNDNGGFDGNITMTGPFEASTDDLLGYINTGNSALEITRGPNWTYGKSQRRTYTLSNGQVIWDFAGNCWEWTSGKVTGGEPGGAVGDLGDNRPGYPGFGFRYWSDIRSTGIQGSISPQPSPLDSGVIGINNWDLKGTGIGTVYSSSIDTVERGVIRGNYWDDGSDAGVFGLWLGDKPNAVMNSTGFRVAR